MYYHIPYAQDNIAAWYSEATSEINVNTTRQWSALGRESYAQGNRLLGLHGLELLRVTGQPYDSSDEMFEDIERGVLQVSTDHSGHPLLNFNDNLHFRVWHDMAHYEAKADFTYAGEVRTYLKQLQHVSDFSSHPFNDMRHALFVEVLGQAACQVITGVFPVQKVF
jgi:hypothetical protein